MHSTKRVFGALICFALILAAFSAGQFRAPLDAHVTPSPQANEVSAVPIRPHMTEVQLWLAAENADRLCTALIQSQAKGAIKLPADVQARVDLLSKNLRNVEKSSGFSLTRRGYGGSGPNSGRCICIWDSASGVLIINRTCPVHAGEF